MNSNYLTAVPVDNEKVEKLIPCMEAFFDAVQQRAKEDPGFSANAATGNNLPVAISKTEFFDYTVNVLFGMAQMISPKGAIGSAFITGFAMGAMCHDLSTGFGKPDAEVKASTPLENLILEEFSKIDNLPADPDSETKPMQAADIMIVVNGKEVNLAEAVKRLHTEESVQ